MAKKKEKKVERPEGAVPNEAFVIGLTAMVNTAVKGVTFSNGVGVLDYPGLAMSREDWFETVDGFLVQKQGFGLDVLVDYFKNQHSAKITKIAAKDSEKLKNALAAGKLIDKKYYKVFPGKEKAEQKATEEKTKTYDPEPNKKVGSDDLADGGTNAGKTIGMGSSTTGNPKEKPIKGSKES